MKERDQMPLFQLEGNLFTSFPTRMLSALTPNISSAINKNSSTNILTGSTGGMIGKFQPANHIVEFSRKSSQASTAKILTSFNPSRKVSPEKYAEPVLQSRPMTTNASANRPLSRPRMPGNVGYPKKRMAKFSSSTGIDIDGKLTGPTLNCGVSGPNSAEFNQDM